MLRAYLTHLCQSRPSNSLSLLRNVYGILSKRTILCSNLSFFNRPTPFSVPRKSQSEIGLTTYTICSAFPTCYEGIFSKWIFQDRYKLPYLVSYDTASELPPLT